MTRNELFAKMHKLKYRLKRSKDGYNDYGYIPQCTAPGITVLINSLYYYIPSVNEVKKKCLKLFKGLDVKLTSSYKPVRGTHSYSMSKYVDGVYNVMVIIDDINELVAVCELWIKLKTLVDNNA